MNERRLGLGGEQPNAALEKAGERIRQRYEIIQQTCVPRRVAEPHMLASHSAESYFRKIIPSTNPMPSAKPTAFVGLSRTYCSPSSWKVRTRPETSSLPCSAMPR